MGDSNGGGSRTANRSNNKSGGSNKRRSNSNNSHKKSRSQRHPKGNAQAKKRRNNRGRKGPKLSGFEKVERGYLNLLEKHLEARKKYYDLFHRADPRQLAKLEKNFYRTLDEMRDYEDNISEEFREEFDKKFNGLKLDTTYSENHQIPAEPQQVATEGDFEDPHLLATQKESQFKDDEEESSGSLEDYYNYKGIDPQSIKPEDPDKALKAKSK